MSVIDNPVEIQRGDRIFLIPIAIYNDILSIVGRLRIDVRYYVSMTIPFQWKEMSSCNTLISITPGREPQIRQPLFHAVHVQFLRRSQRGRIGRANAHRSRQRKRRIPRIIEWPVAEEHPACGVGEVGDIQIDGDGALILAVYAETADLDGNGANFQASTAAQSFHVRSGKLRTQKENAFLAEIPAVSFFRGGRDKRDIGDRPIFSAQHFSASPPCRAIPAPQHRLDLGQKTFVAQDNFSVREYGISKWWAVPDTRLSCSTLPARKAVSSAWVR